MKRFKLKDDFKGFKKGTQFYLVAESEFIGIKEFVFRTIDLSVRISTNEREMLHYFVEITSFYSEDTK
ncbi:hypothetical protein [Bacillus sp. PS06]|uniref:hypothetical protein n=1 Tax=Bacillus sp. PS06 TaxID=2764176 RepID=UPI00177D9119|nr:hypothetical protein [Bacillus sp. PS06]MBD8067852.1 hypothetical protein [Bacillus sp. PS06]